MGMDAQVAPHVDGRRARRERGRRSVIDAMFELMQTRKVPPSVDLIAERAGVSVASIFRYFDGLDDLLLQTFSRFRERYAPVIAIVGGEAIDSDVRIARLVTARLDLYEQAGAIMAIGRLRALEHEPMVEASAQMRALLADQVRATVAPETVGTSPVRAAELVATIDALTSLDSWDVMCKTHGRSRGEITRAWTFGIDALISAWKDRAPR